MPTALPTTPPTRDPSAVPTSLPTTNPTTPAPLYNGDLVCGDHVFGDYNDAALEFRVRMLFDGEMVFDASNSSFVVTSLVAVNLATDVDGDGVLTRSGLTRNVDYTFELAAADGTFGRFDVQILCESAAPTVQPTMVPTLDPTTLPTERPTTDPTVESRGVDTLRPTTEPTATPRPTTSEAVKSQDDGGVSDTVLIVALVVGLLVVAMIVGALVYCQRSRNKLEMAVQREHQQQTEKTSTTTTIAVDGAGIAGVLGSSANTGENGNADEELLAEGGQTTTVARERQDESDGGSDGTGDEMYEHGDMTPMTPNQ